MVLSFPCLVCSSIWHLCAISWYTFPPLQTPIPIAGCFLLLSLPGSSFLSGTSTQWQIPGFTLGSFFVCAHSLPQRSKVTLACVKLTETNQCAQSTVSAVWLQPAFVSPDSWLLPLIPLSSKEDFHIGPFRWQLFQMFISPKTIALQPFFQWGKVRVQVFITTEGNFFSTVKLTSWQ